MKNRCDPDGRSPPAGGRVRLGGRGPRSGGQVMRARIAVATVILVVSAGLSAAADELESIRLRVPRGGVEAFPIPGLEPWIVVRTQGSPQSPIQPKAAPGGKAPPKVLDKEELDKRIA